MATKSKTKNESPAKRDAPKIVNILQIGGNSYSLGDLRKADFSEVEHAKTSVKSNTEVLNQIIDILKGIAAAQD